MVPSLWRDAPSWFRYLLFFMLGGLLVGIATGCTDEAPRPQMEEGVAAEAEEGDLRGKPKPPDWIPPGLLRHIDTSYNEPGFDTTVVDSAQVANAARGRFTVKAPTPRSGVDTVTTPTGDSVATPWTMVVRLGAADTFYRVPTSPGGTLGGMKLGAFACPSHPPPPPYGFCASSIRPFNVVDIIQAHRKAGTKLVLMLNGGNHARYRTREPIESWRQKGFLTRFNMAVWKDSLSSYNRPHIVAAIDSGVKDGTIIGHGVMDEPGNVSTATGNYWAYPGFMTRATVNELCRESKKYFPNLPVGPIQDPRLFDPQGTYTTDCDFSHVQYRLTKDRDLGAYIQAVKQSLPAHMKILWSINTLHGGEPSRTCPKYADDPYGVLCAITPQQLRAWVPRFGRDPRTCGGVNTWRWWKGYSDEREFLKASKEVAETLQAIPYVPCKGAP